jgi:hypothetical protein
MSPVFFRAFETMAILFSLFSFFYFSTVIRFGLSPVKMDQLYLKMCVSGYVQYPPSGGSWGFSRA